MKKIIFISLPFLLLVTCLSAQDSSISVRDPWSYNTSYLMPKGKWESGIAQPFRYGLSEKIEIHSNAIEFLVFPNIGLKIAQGSHNGYVFASDHLLSYPTLFLNTVSAKGIGGLISPEFVAPFLLSFSNSILVTKPAGTGLFTAYAGFAFAIRSSKPDPQSTIDLPLVYPRMAHNYEGTSIRFGVAYKGRLSNKFFYEEGVRFFVITRPQNNFFFENYGNLMWVAGRSLRIKGGYNLSYGEYPSGTMWQLWPALDIVFGSRVR